MNNDPSETQHASRPGLMTYVSLVAIAIGVCVVIYAQSLKDFFGFN